MHKFTLKWYVSVGNRGGILRYLNRQIQKCIQAMLMVEEQLNAIYTKNTGCRAAILLSKFRSLHEFLSTDICSKELSSPLWYVFLFQSNWIDATINSCTTEKSDSENPGTDLTDH